ncbi:uncharacterized protein SPAPADRAFT_49958 [Spathaspora passalidarum NRRL Y-27907]|uniref:Flo11 domain-containing protein n=1 Tax=Spathaspora passalidarum (strain NRRL Y-27907 / 11-Y1) TaxID=619300 RepID=G3AKY9_SPAPN|nr:uncharacterized protein SPAPADRAFT_49958 [Spathaspora passalidarum NRRL Y-27907]EGW33032.1 hypothetical protein SPAPADRAFT_49958 [Spathaspora passalidarum NRRL Y-27907]
MLQFTFIFYLLGYMFLRASAENCFRDDQFTPKCYIEQGGNAMKNNYPILKEFKILDSVQLSEYNYLLHFSFKIDEVIAFKFMPKVESIQIVDLYDPQRTEILYDLDKGINQIEGEFYRFSVNWIIDADVFNNEKVCTTPFKVVYTGASQVSMNKRGPPVIFEYYHACPESNFPSDTPQLCWIQICKEEELPDPPPIMKPQEPEDDTTISTNEVNFSSEEAVSTTVSIESSPIITIPSTIETSFSNWAHPTYTSCANQILEDKCDVTFGQHSKSQNFPQLKTFEFVEIERVQDWFYQVIIEFEISPISNAKLQYVRFHVADGGSVFNYLSTGVLYDYNRNINLLGFSPYHFFIRWQMMANIEGDLVCAPPLKVEYMYILDQDEQNGLSSSDLEVVADYVYDCKNGDVPLQCWDLQCSKSEAPIEEIVTSLQENSELTEEEESTTSLEMEETSDILEGTSESTHEEFDLTVETITDTTETITDTTETTSLSEQPSVTILPTLFLPGDFPPPQEDVPEEVFDDVQCKISFGEFSENHNFPNLEIFEFRSIKKISEDYYEVEVEFKIDNSQLPTDNIDSIQFTGLQTANNYLGDTILLYSRELNGKLDNSPHHFLVHWVMEAGSYDEDYVCTTPFQVEYKWTVDDTQQRAISPQSQNSLPPTKRDEQETAIYIHDCPQDGNADLGLICWRIIEEDNTISELSSMTDSENEESTSLSVSFEEEEEEYTTASVPLQIIISNAPFDDEDLTSTSVEDTITAPTPAETIDPIEEEEITNVESHKEQSTDVSYSQETNTSYPETIVSSLEENTFSTLESSEVTSNDASIPHEEVTTLISDDISSEYIETPIIATTNLVTDSAPEDIILSSEESFSQHSQIFTSSDEMISGEMESTTDSTIYSATPSTIDQTAISSEETLWIETETIANTQVTTTETFSESHSHVVSDSPPLATTLTEIITTTSIDPSNPNFTAILTLTLTTTYIDPPPVLITTTVSESDSTYVTTITEPFNPPVIATTTVSRPDTTYVTTITEPYNPSVVVTTITRPDTTYVTTVMEPYNPPPVVVTVSNPDTAYVGTVTNSYVPSGVVTTIVYPDTTLVTTVMGPYVPPPFVTTVTGVNTVYVTTVTYPTVYPPAPTSPQPGGTTPGNVTPDQEEELQVPPSGGNPNDPANPNYPGSNPNDSSNSNVPANPNYPGVVPEQEEELQVQYPGGNPNSPVNPNDPVNPNAPVDPNYPGVTPEQEEELQVQYPGGGSNTPANPDGPAGSPNTPANPNDPSDNSNTQPGINPYQEEELQVPSTGGNPNSPAGNPNSSSGNSNDPSLEQQEELLQDPNVFTYTSAVPTTFVSDGQTYQTVVPVVYTTAVPDGGVPEVMVSPNDNPSPSGFNNNLEPDLEELLEDYEGSASGINSNVFMLCLCLIFTIMFL